MLLESQPQYPIYDTNKEACRVRPTTKPCKYPMDQLYIGATTNNNDALTSSHYPTTISQTRTSRNLSFLSSSKMPSRDSLPRDSKLPAAESSEPVTVNVEKPVNVEKKPVNVETTATTTTDASAVVEVVETIPPVPEFPDLSSLGDAFNRVNRPTIATDPDSAAKAWLKSAIAKTIKNLQEGVLLLLASKDDPMLLPAYAFDTMETETESLILASPVPHEFKPYKPQFQHYLIQFLESCGLNARKMGIDRPDEIVTKIEFCASLKGSGVKDSALFDAAFQEEFFSRIGNLV